MNLNQVGGGVHCSPAREEVWVSTLLVKALVDVMQQRGVALADLPQRAVEILHSEPMPQLVTLADFQALLLQGIQVSGEQGLGLYCGLHASESCFGLMSPLVSHAATLREAVAVVVRFHPLLVDGVQLRLVEQMGTAEIRCKLEVADDSVLPSFGELMVAGLWRMLQRFGCRVEDLCAVRFEHAHPVHYPLYASLFGGTERFRQAYAGLEFRASVLDRLHLHRHGELHRLMHAEAERRLGRLHRPASYTAEVRCFLRSQPPGSFPDLLAAARSLRLGTRTLRRRLEVEGTSYRALLQLQRYEVACTLLRDPKLAVHQVAGQLGYADASAFDRAFKRWARCSPRQYRKSALAACKEA